MRVKRRLIVILALPILVLPGWFLYEQILVWITPAPRWIIPGSQENYFGSCWSAARSIADDFQSVPAEEMLPPKVTYRQARDIVNHFIAKRYHFVLFLTNPTLERVTFPDGQQRLAWYQLVIVDLSDHGMKGEANVLFVDAWTGEPLMLVTDIVIGDPQMACGWSSEIPVLPDQFLALVLLTFYLAISSVLGLLIWRWRASLSGKRSSSEKADDQ